MSNYLIVKKVASLAIGLLPEKGEPLWTCQGRRVLGEIYQHKREAKKAIHRFEIALRTASSLDRAGQLSQIHYRLAQIFSGEVGAQTHLERPEPHAVNNTSFSPRYLSAGSALVSSR